MPSPATAPFEQEFAHTIFKQRYAFNQDESWSELSERVIKHPMGELFKAPGAKSGRVGVGTILDAQERLFRLHNRRKFVAGGRYLFGAGRDFHQVNNCILLNCPDTREGWATTSYQAEMALLTGAGIGAYYGELRPGGVIVVRTRGTASGPIAKIIQVNEVGRAVISGGNRRSAIWAGLPWFHNDIHEFIAIKDWHEAKFLTPDGHEFSLADMKQQDWTAPAPCDMTNVSVCLDDAFFAAYEGREDDCVRLLRQQAPEWLQKQGVDKAPTGGSWTDWSRDVYERAVTHMLKHGEPGFSVDTGDKWREKLRNACTEITSADDSDVCNLGSLVLPRFDSLDEFEEAVRDSVLFLTAGTEYSDVPYAKVGEVRSQNRRLGLGLIGGHEFLMKNGVRYGTDEAFEVLEPYMEIYARALEFAHEWQNELGLSLSLGATAIAPNGTIGIVAESTPSNDPMFSAAELRQIKNAHHSGNDTYVQHVVIDPVALRMMNEGVDPSLIEDSYTLGLQPERRIRHQAWTQQYVDHAISSTVNLHTVMTGANEIKDFGGTMMRHLPKLRGLTVYPDGARAGQPRTSVPLEWALQQKGQIIETDDATCAGGVCGV